MSTLAPPDSLAERIQTLFDQRAMPTAGSDVQGATPPAHEDVHFFFFEGRVEVTPNVDAISRHARTAYLQLSGGLTTWARRISMSPFRRSSNAWSEDPQAGQNGALESGAPNLIATYASGRRGRCNSNQEGGLLSASKNPCYRVRQNRMRDILTRGSFLENSSSRR